MAKGKKWLCDVFINVAVNCHALISGCCLRSTLEYYKRHALVRLIWIMIQIYLDWILEAIYSLQPSSRIGYNVTRNYNVNNFT